MAVPTYEIQSVGAFIRMSLKLQLKRNSVSRVSSCWLAATAIPEPIQLR